MPPSLLELVNPATGHFKRELTVSLATKEYADAKRRDIREARRVMDLMDLAARFVQGAVSHEEIGVVSSSPVPGEIEADIISALLKEDEAFREDGDARKHLQTPEERAQWPDLLDPFGQLGMAEGVLEAEQGYLEVLSEDYRQASARRDPSIVKAELHRYLKDHSNQ